MASPKSKMSDLYTDYLQTYHPQLLEEHSDSSDFDNLTDVDEDFIDIRNIKKNKLLLNKALLRKVKLKRSAANHENFNCRREKKHKEKKVQVVDRTRRINGTDTDSVERLYKSYEKKNIETNDESSSEINIKKKVTRSTKVARRPNYNNNKDLSDTKKKHITNEQTDNACQVYSVMCDNSSVRFKKKNLSIEEPIQEEEEQDAHFNTKKTVNYSWPRHILHSIKESDTNPFETLETYSSISSEIDNVTLDNKSYVEKRFSPYKNNASRYSNEKEIKNKSEISYKKKQNYQVFSAPQNANKGVCTSFVTENPKSDIMPARSSVFWDYVANKIQRKSHHEEDTCSRPCNCSKDLKLIATIEESSDGTDHYVCLGGCKDNRKSSTPKKSESCDDLDKYMCLGGCKDHQKPPTLKKIEPSRDFECLGGCRDNRKPPAPVRSESFDGLDKYECHAGCKGLGKPAISIKTESSHGQAKYQPSPSKDNRKSSKSKKATCACPPQLPEYFEESCEQDYYENIETDDIPEDTAPCQHDHDLVAKALSQKYNGEILCIHNPPCVLVNGCLNVPKKESTNPTWFVTQDMKPSYYQNSNTQDTHMKNHQRQSKYINIMQYYNEEDRIEKEMQSVCQHYPPCKFVRQCYKPKHPPKLDHCCVHVPMCRKIPQCILETGDYKYDYSSCSHKPKCFDLPLCARELVLYGEVANVESEVKKPVELVCYHHPQCIKIPRCLGRMLCETHLASNAIPDCTHDPPCEQIPACYRRSPKMVSTYSQYPAPCRIV
ncbi:uncharacterized protein LOC128672946 [Plodia interpunctella]|uniref:uncharacterized protein LOC128672946 n=1 Tax=Plodia interpunctella TaxID=58824 RepID=UPI00236799A6|nr:uncharacterized protein LOC128672946 [Plodia interpunctella]